MAESNCQSTRITAGRDANSHCGAKLYKGKLKKVTQLSKTKVPVLLKCSTDPLIEREDVCEHTRDTGMAEILSYDEMRI